MISFVAQCGLFARRSSISLAPLYKGMGGAHGQSLVFLTAQPSPLQGSASLQNMASSLDQQIRFRSNRSRRGLYDGKDVRAGNSLSFSMKANKRKFKPNVFKKRVYSEILEEMIQFHLTTSALRSIDKAGGLDNYLLKSKHVSEGEGKVAKTRVLQAMKYVEKQKQKAEAEAGSGMSGEAVAKMDWVKGLDTPNFTLIDSFWAY